jgi:hypothetical protein
VPAWHPPEPQPARSLLETVGPAFTARYEADPELAIATSISKSMWTSNPGKQPEQLLFGRHAFLHSSVSSVTLFLWRCCWPAGMLTPLITSTPPDTPLPPIRLMPSSPRQATCCVTAPA